MQRAHRRLNCCCLLRVSSTAARFSVCSFRSFFTLLSTYARQKKNTSQGAMHWRVSDAITSDH